MGAALGLDDGAAVVGVDEGAALGEAVGLADGAKLGAADGREEGSAVKKKGSRSIAGMNCDLVLLNVATMAGSTVANAARSMPTRAGSGWMLTRISVQRR